VYNSKTDRVSLIRGVVNSQAVQTQKQTELIVYAFCLGLALVVHMLSIASRGQRGAHRLKEIRHSIGRLGQSASDHHLREDVVYKCLS
jgi:hypothetical protein